MISPDTNVYDYKSIQLRDFTFNDTYKYIKLETASNKNFNFDNLFSLIILDENNKTCRFYNFYYKIFTSLRILQSYNDKNIITKGVRGNYNHNILETIKPSEAKSIIDSYEVMRELDK